jgi:hypothetical protein
MATGDIPNGHGSLDTGRLPVTLPCGLGSAGDVVIKKGACDLDGTCDSGGWRLDL